MAKRKFEIGEKEKHTIVVGWNLFMKHIKIELDGRTVADKYHYSPGPEKFHFDVGDKEKHKVEISAGGFFPIRLVVDGKPAKRMDSNG
jgi:hypothetical protein